MARAPEEQRAGESPSGTTSGSASPVYLRVVLLTAVAMIAFAGNSLLCRLALGRDLIDPASFATVRVVSGAATLAFILMFRGRPGAGGGWRPALMLFVYVAFFSFAYVSLGAGTGALILFGAVQLTMFIAALRAGEHFSLIAWTGLVLAISGLAYLVAPGLSAPDTIGAALMAAAGLGWGLYSLMGRGAVDPLGATARNFLLCAPLVVIVSLLFLPQMHVSSAGLFLAVASGAVTSGLGYVIWYAALPRLTATRASVVQLTVPVITAFAGVLILSEPVTLRLLLAAAATLGGVALVVAQRSRMPAALPKR
jgi:drug/metabolite transporter (DMT)-like permease